MTNFDDSSINTDAEQFHKSHDSFTKPNLVSSSSVDYSMRFGSSGNLSNSFYNSSGDLHNRGGSFGTTIFAISRAPVIQSRPTDTATGFCLSQRFIPRPEKTLTLFSQVISTLIALNQKFTKLTNVGDRPEGTEVSNMSKMVEERLMLIQCLQWEYQSLIKDKEEVLKELQSSLTTTFNIETKLCDDYWLMCRDMCITETKLEKCTGKLQFQIMELDSISRVNPLDQFELIIRLNESSKFKTKVKVEKNCRQVWDNTTFVLNPIVENIFHVTLKNLNKSTVLFDKDIPLVNNLLLPDPNIYTIWITPLGTIKLKMIVQWNANLGDPDLIATLNQFDRRSYGNGVVIRNRANSANTLNAVNRHSLHFSDMPQPAEIYESGNSMANILEHIESNVKPDVYIRKASTERDSRKVKAEYHDRETSNKVIEDTIIIPTGIDINYIQHEENMLIEPKRNPEEELVPETQSLFIVKEEQNDEGMNLDENLEDKCTVKEQEYTDNSCESNTQKSSTDCTEPVENNLCIFIKDGFKTDTRSTNNTSDLDSKLLKGSTFDSLYKDSKVKPNDISIVSDEPQDFSMIDPLFYNETHKEDMIKVSIAESESLPIVLLSE